MRSALSRCGRAAQEEDTDLPLDEKDVLVHTRVVLDKLELVRMSPGVLFRHVEEARPGAGDLYKKKFVTML